MKAIIYSKEHNSVTCDSRCLSQNSTPIHSENYEKFLLHGDSLYFRCGDIVDAKDLIDTIISGEKSDRDFQVEATVIRDGVASMVYSGNLKMHPCEDKEAVLNDGKFTISALDFGTSPTGAVEYTIDRDSWCGGVVRVFDINTLEEL